MRFYEPGIGRFIARDMLWYLNRYRAYTNRPPTQVDPLGLMDVDTKENPSDRGGQDTKTEYDTAREKVDDVNKALDAVRTVDDLVQTRKAAEEAAKAAQKATDAAKTSPGLRYSDPNLPQKRVSDKAVEEALKEPKKPSTSPTAGLQAIASAQLQKEIVGAVKALGGFADSSFCKRFYKAGMKLDCCSMEGNLQKCYEDILTSGATAAAALNARRLLDYLLDKCYEAEAAQKKAGAGSGGGGGGG